MSDQLRVSVEDVRAAAGLLGLDPERFDHTLRIEITPNRVRATRHRTNESGHVLRLEDIIEVAVLRCSCPDVDVPWGAGSGDGTVKGYEAECPIHGRGGTEPTYREAE